MKRRNLFTTLAVVSVFAVVASACSNSNDTGGGGGSASGGATVDCSADPFGCVQVAAGDPIQLASLLSISGDTAFLGTDSVHGIQLAIDNLDGTMDGTDGQLLGHDVTLQQEDDRCSAEGGQAGATALAANPDIVAVIGTSCSSAALGVADTILSDKGMLLFSPSNTNPGADVGRRRTSPSTRARRTTTRSRARSSPTSSTPSSVSRRRRRSTTRARTPTAWPPRSATTSRRSAGRSPTSNR